MEAVHVLAVVNGFYDALLVDVVGQGQLHDKAVHVGIFVELVNAVEEFFLRHVVLKAMER